MITMDYPTRPVESWAKMKEHRKKHFSRIWSAQKEGDVLIMGTVQVFVSLFSGLGNYANCNYAPQFTRLMGDQSLAVRNFEAFEAKGFGHEMCAAMRCHMGQIYQNLSLTSPLGGEYHPDFIFDFSWCADAAKTAQLAGEYLGVPYFVLDVPYDRSQIGIDYLVDQMHEAIEWMEKVTGRVYDDEKLIAGVNNEWECCYWWAKTCELTKTVPTPYDARHLNSLRLPAVTSRQKKEVVEYMKMVYDEGSTRVKDGISARGFEKKRLSLDTCAPFFLPRLLNWPEDYGAIVVGGLRFFDAFGAWRIDENYVWHPMEPPRMRGIMLKNREEALRALAELNAIYLPIQNLYGDLSHATEEYLQFVKDWKIEASIIALDRGCKGYLSGGHPEKMLALKRAGIPVTGFNTSMADPRDFDEKAVREQIDTFLESLGLSK